MTENNNSTEDALRRAVEEAVDAMGLERTARSLTNVIRNKQKIQGPDPELEEKCKNKESVMQIAREAMEVIGEKQTLDLLVNAARIAKRIKESPSGRDASGPTR